jgi:signal recognition particle subunit SRP54
MAFESLTDRLAGVFKKLRGHGKLTEADIKAAMREVRMALLEADVNYKVAKDFCAKVSERAMGQEVMESLTPAQQVVKIVNEELVALMGGSEAARLNIKNKGQTIIMLCGLQGNGKTTHAAKLAKYFIKQGRRPMLVACDIYRPAAIDQLQVVGKQAGAPVFTLPGAKPPEIAKKALAHAKDYGNDIVILDTAGRLHNKANLDDVLMQELVDIKEAVPVDETLLVVDAMAGQDAVNVAKTFNEKVSIDGIILTKTDGDTRGGAALSVLAVTGKPIKFQGTGEKLDDLDVFHPDRMASRILGMGDVLSLIERAQETADEKAAEETAKRMMENKFDMNDMLDQFAQIRKMGGAGAMLSMLPGGSGIDPSQVDEKAFDRIEAMIYSMTKEEREKPSIINPKRKRRIAAGSGTTVADVNKLLKQFEMMQKMMKQFKKSPKGFARRLGGMMGNPNAFRGLK